MYHTEDIKRSISIDEMQKKYVDVDKFLQYCKACSNYDKKWSCPNYDFNPIDIWQEYDNISILGRKIIYDKAVTDKTYTDEEINKILSESMMKERSVLDELLLSAEESTKNSRALYAGSCTLCKSCTKTNGEKCRYPQKMRYSIEALGGNVALLTEELLGVPLKWSKDGKLPEYFTLVCGLLCKGNDEAH